MGTDRHRSTARRARSRPGPGDLGQSSALSRPARPGEGLRKALIALPSFTGSVASSFAPRSSRLKFEGSGLASIPPWGRSARRRQDVKDHRADVNPEMPSIIAWWL